MRRTTKFLGVAAVLFALSGVGASSSSAYSTATGHINVSALGVTVQDCDFTMVATDLPPRPLELIAATFAGSGDLDPCDPFEIALVLEPHVFSFLGSGSHWTASISDIYLINSVVGCDWEISNRINLSTNGGVLGPYAGSGHASGSGGFVCLSGADMTISNLVFS